MDFELLDPSQEAFFDKYVNKKYLRKKKREQQVRLGEALARHDERKGAVADVLAQIPMLPSGSPLHKERDALFTKYNAIDAGMKLKGLSSALTALADANGKFDALLVEAKAFVTKAFSASAGDTDPQETIKRLKQAASIEQRDHLIAYRDASATALAKMAEVSGEAPVNPPVVGAFEAAFTGFLTRIRAVNETGSASDAETALNAIKSEMTAAYAQHHKALTDFASSDAMETMIANAQLKGRAIAALNGINDAVAQLQTWGLPAARDFAAKATTISDKIGPLFDAEPDPNKATEIAKGRETLTAAAEKIQTDADAAVEAHRIAFEEPQQRLRRALGKEKARFAALDPKSFEKGQKQPADDLLAMTETALNGLNGCNIAALDPASKLIFEFSKLVDELEKLAETNAAIKADLKEMGTAIKRHSGSKNILHETFAEHQAAFDTLSGEWAGMVPSDAVAAVAALKAKVDADVTRQDALVARRAEIAARIKETRAAFGDLTKALNALQKENGMKKGDYRGQLASDLATCEEWNATKLDLAFYTTIDARLDRINKGIGDTLKGLEATEGLSDTDVMAKAALAQKQFEDAVAAMGDTIDPAAYKSAKAALDAQLDMLGIRAALVSEDQRAEKAIEDAKQAKADYLADADAWLKDIAAQAKSGDHAKILTDYADDVKVQTDRIKGSVSAVKKGSSVPAAVSELAFVKKTVEGIKKRGEQSKKTELDKIGEQWKSALKTFLDNRDNLIGEVDAFEKRTDASQNAKAKLETALTAIIRNLDRAAFDPPARVFADEAASARDRLAAREMALAEVRRMNDLILNDPVIRKCTRNPFDIRAFADPVARRLRQIELEVLRGVART